MPGPISPNDIAAAKIKHIPEAVFEAFNELIVENFRNGQAKFELAEVRKRIINKIPFHNEHTTTHEYMNDRGWFDIEKAYEQNGWSSVEFNKPSYDENFKSYYIFRK